MELTGYLRRQSELLDLQIRDHQELQDLEVAHLRVRRWRDRLEVAVMASAAIFAVALVIGFGAMVWQAANSRDVVIDTFSVPPSLTANGLTGEVVAKRVLDQIDAMQISSNSTLENPAAYRREGQDPIRIAIPAAGISVGDLDRYLHRWLGHETHISGEVVVDGAGFQAVARFGGQPAVAANGPDAATVLNKLAEGMFEQVRPLRYADYLINLGRLTEAEAVLSRLAAHGPVPSRALALAGWANVRMGQGDPPGAWEKATSAVDLDPTNAIAQAWLASVAYMSGRAEGTFSGSKAAVRQSEIGAGGQGTRLLSDTSTLYFTEMTQEVTGDFSGAVRTWRSILSSASVDTLSPDQLISQRASVQALDHDVGSARALAEQLPSRTKDGQPSWGGAIPRVVVSVAAEDWPGAIAVGDPALAAAAVQPQAAIFVQSFLRPGLAIAHAHLGDFDGAERIIGATALSCDACVIARGRIAALRGDATASDRWFALAAASSPSTPFADTAWGEALLARGKTDEAIARLERAHRSGPRFADPIELWGEALARKGAFNEAAAKFAEAAQYAPRWGRLHIKWGEALAHIGKGAEARAQFAAAAGMELSAADRAELALAYRA